MSRKVLTYFLCLVICSILPSCGPIEDKAITAIQNSIAELDKNSSDWQATMTNLEQQLIQQGQSTLANEVQSLENRGIANGGVELRCDADFIGQRMKQGLQGIMDGLQKKPVPPVTPAYCNVDPQNGIQLELVSQRRQISLNYYGYDMFDKDASDSQMKVFLRDRNGNESDITFAMALPTHYLMTVNLEDNRIKFTNQSDKLLVRWEQTTLSTINIIQPPTPMPVVIVRNLQVLFHTNDDDKDDDTGISVTIANGYVAEWHQTQNQRFSDKSDIIKPLNPNSVPLTTLRGQLLEICISPNGNDTWRFNVTLMGNPSDGSRYLFSATGIELTQDNRCREWVLPR